MQELEPGTTYDGLPCYSGVTTDGRIICVLADVYAINYAMNQDIPLIELGNPDTWITGIDGENVMILCPFCPEQSRRPIDTDFYGKPCEIDGMQVCHACFVSSVVD